MTLQWLQVEGCTAFVTITAQKTYTVRYVFDTDAWVYEGRRFEHVDMAKGAAQTEHWFTLAKKAKE